MTNTEPTPIQHSINLTEIAPDTFVDASGHQLTPKEVRNIVTPHDFAVANTLFGLEIARPWRRGIAIAIDALIIAILAGGADLVFFTPVYLFLVWRCHQLKTFKRRNILLALLPLVFIFAQNQSTAPDQTTDLNITDTLQLGAVTIKLNSENCDVSCADKQSEMLINTLVSNNISDDKAAESLKGILENSALSAVQQQEKLNQLMLRRQQLTAARQLLSEQPEPQSKTQAPEPGWWQKLQASDHSLVKWIEGILADLGISFGWAIAYFTVFISWNNGQTPGKRLLGIKVVQLNNQPISLWGAFGRQGGYTAGFATGLLGFAQIYWDPNRQAVQDKLADTLVLKV
jgi:uncharacterized RDD family membrane protein YckC